MFFHPPGFQCPQPIGCPPATPPRRAPNPVLHQILGFKASRFRVLEARCRADVQGSCFGQVLNFKSSRLPKTPKMLLQASIKIIIYRHNDLSQFDEYFSSQAIQCKQKPWMSKIAPLAQCGPNQAMFAAAVAPTGRMHLLRETG